MRLMNKVNEPEWMYQYDDREKTDLNVSNTRETVRRQGQRELQGGQTVRGETLRESSTKGFEIGLQS